MPLPSFLMALLLVATPAETPPAVPPYLLLALSLAGLGFGVYSFFRRESREDQGKRESVEEARFVELEEKLEALAKKDALLAAEQINQRNTIHEMIREREQLKGDVIGQLRQLQKDVHLLEPVPGRVGTLEAKFLALDERISNIKEILGDLKEGQKENKREVLEAIKQIRP